MSQEDNPWVAAQPPVPPSAEGPGADAEMDAGMDVERLRTVMDVVPDAVVVTTGNGDITLVNRQTEVLFGYARADLLGQPVEVLIPERLRAVHHYYRAQYQAMPGTHPMGAHLQLFGRRQDGSEFPIEASLSPFVGAAGELTVIATIRDISERQRIEMARVEAEAATEELRRLQAITDVALTHRTLDDLLPALLDRLYEVMQVDNVAILLVGEDEQVLTVRAVRGLEEEVAAHIQVPVGQGFAGRIAASREPLVVEDLATFPVVSQFLKEKVRSAAGVPLLVEGRLIGVVHIDSRAPRHFTERDVRLLQLVAERITLAIDHARLYEAEQIALARARVSEVRFQRLMESNIIGLLIVEGETIIEANEAFLHLVGYTRTDLLAGRLRWPTLTSTRHRAASERAFNEVLATGSCMPFEMEYLRQEGSRVPVLVGLVRLEQQPLRLVALIVDLTERKRLEREREEARARELAIGVVNRHLDQFFTTAAHDIRNPVAVVKGNVQLALRQFERLQALLTTRTGKLDAQLVTVRTSLVDADRSADRLTRLVGKLFDVTCARTGNLQMHLGPCDLVTLVREQVEAQRVATSSRILLLQVPETPQSVPVLADTDRLNQVLANYITNALKYSAEDKPVEVRLEVVEGRAVVSVRDYGSGLPLEEQMRVWELFHRAPGVAVQSNVECSNAGCSSGSLGLGLYISKRIVELHHGQVGVESVVGQGSTFWFTLPLAAPSTVQEER